MVFDYEEKVYNFSDKRLKYLFDCYSSNSVEKYAQAYVTWIQPLDYLSLTTSDVQGFLDKTKPLDYKELCAERQEIRLTVDFEAGEVVGHEGRHRMAALHKSGAAMVAVVVKAYGEKGKYDRDFIERFTVKGQEFNYIEPPRRAPGVVDLRCLLPLSKAERDLVLATYGPAVVLESFKDKRIYAVEDISQFSTGRKVFERQEYIGIVKGFSDNRDYPKAWDPNNPYEPVYVHMHNERNPKGYQDFVLKVDDFLGWIKDGKYKVPAKDMPGLDEMIDSAKGLTETSVVTNVIQSFERE